MNTPKHPLKRIIPILLAGSLPGPLAFAQTAVPPDEEEEVIVLSPFVVEESAELGYMATNTLAGTRLNTQLKEVGAAVSVYTQEFLDDIDANKLENILTYTTSTEGGGVSGNYAGFTGESSDAVRDDPSSVIRVRALAEATRTRDYFASDIPSDTYNFSTLTISRGPNAILAGNGSAGGIMDASMRQATFNDRYEFKLRFAEHQSHREELHLNQVLIDNVLAVRVDALNEKQKFQQKPTYDRDQRVYVAATLKLRSNQPDAFLGSTTLRANVELGSIEGVPPNTLPPVMSVQSWFEGTDPRDGEPWASPKWYTDGAQRKIYNADGTIVNNADIIAGFPLYRQWALVYADPSSGVAGVGLTDPDLAAVQGFMGTVPTGGGAPGGYLRGTGDQNRNRKGFYRTRLMDREVFDYYDQLLTGVFDYREQSFDATDIRLEQLLMGGKAGLELAYNVQNFERRRDFPISGGDNEIFIDATKYLSVRTDAWNDKGPIADQLIENPNFGRPFVISRDNFRDQSNASERESFQVTAFLKHDFTGSNTLLGRLLGRHTLSGLYFETDVTRINRTYLSTWDPNGELSLIDSTGNIPGTFPAQVNAFYYLGDSMLNVATEDGIRLNPITTQRPQYGETYTLRIYDVAQKKFVTGSSTPLRVLGTARDQREEIRSQALALQSNWLGDHLITLFGWRKDESDAFTSLDPDRLPDGNLDMSNFTLVPASSQSQDSWTKSVVVNFPEKYLFELPLDSDLRFYWNESENFNPVGQRRNQWNEELGSPSASTEEYGIGLSMFDGKLDIRINKFETRITNDAVSGVGNAYGYTSTLITRMLAARDLDLLPADYGYTYSGFGNFEDVARAFYATIPDRLQANIGPEYNFNPRFVETGGVTTWEPDSIVNKASVSDTVSKGTEIEIIWNPTRNWRLGLNAAQNEAVKANVAAAELEYAEAWRHNLETMYEGNLLQGERNPGQAEGNTIWPQYASETLYDIQTANALSGTASPEIREWRVNLVTRYQFNEGFLNGFNVGAALRWQDEIGIGYPLIIDENGNEVADISNPYWGTDQLQVDLSFGYRRKLKVFDRNMDWVVSLNIRNAIADDDLIPILANADGSYGTVRVPPEQTWALTNTFRF